MTEQDTIKTLVNLVNRNIELAKKVGELSAAINLILLKPDLINDSKVKNELQEIANQYL